MRRAARDTVLAVCIMAGLAAWAWWYPDLIRLLVSL